MDDNIYIPVRPGKVLKTTLYLMAKDARKRNAHGISDVLVRLKEEGWSPYEGGTHRGYPPHVRRFVPDLLIIGVQLSRANALGGGNDALMDCWLGHVVPSVIGSHPMTRNDSTR